MKKLTVKTLHSGLMLSSDSTIAATELKDGKDEAGLVVEKCVSNMSFLE